MIFFYISQSIVFNGLCILKFITKKHAWVLLKNKLFQMPNYFVAIYQQGGKLGLNFPKIKILVLFSVENKKLPCVSDL